MKFKSIFRHILYCCSLWIICSCATNPRNGDLIFVTAKSDNLSGAISRVTSRGSGFSFDHIGIIQKQKGTFSVLHAAPKGGSQKQPLADFLSAVRADGQRAALFRLKKEYRKTIPAAINSAENMLGKPYNFSYVLNENSYYCSDFVERAFRDYHIFKLEPMTFKNKATGKTDDYWLKFYEKLGIPVPEGQPGCNPNGLSKSDKLLFVKFFK